MALTLDQLQEFMKKEGLNYFVAPDRPAVRFGVGGLFGRFDLVVHLQDDGRFLQFRTLHYAECATDHPNLAVVLRVLAAINYEKRLLKFGWDPGDGEIVGYADLWVMDGQVTQEQFRRMLQNFVPGIDTSITRIDGALKTGADPGEPNPEALLKRMTGGGASPLPGKLRELLEKLQGKGPPTAPSPAPAPTPGIKEI